MTLDELKKRVYNYPANDVIELLTSFRVPIQGRGHEPFLGEEGKRISISKNVLWTKEEQSDHIHDVNRSIHEMVLLIKAGRKFHLKRPRDACKIFWRIDRFLQVERDSGFGQAKSSRLEDYRALGELADKMLQVMDHLERCSVKDVIEIEEKIEDISANDKAIRNVIDQLGHGFKTAEAKPREDEEPTDHIVRYRNPFARELAQKGISHHDLFRI